MVAFLTSIKRCLIVVLTCISLVISNVEPVSMCLLVIYMPFWYKYLFRSVQFLIALFV